MVVSLAWPVNAGLSVERAAAAADELGSELAARPGADTLVHVVTRGDTRWHRLEAAARLELSGTQGKQRASKRTKSTKKPVGASRNGAWVRRNGADDGLAWAYNGIRRPI